MIFDSYRPSKSFNFNSRLKIKNPQKILDIYDSSKSFKEFFEKIKRDIKNLESDVKPWLDSFVKDVLGFGFITHKKWIIECEKINLQNDQSFEIRELDKEPFVKYKGKYVSIVKRNHYLKQIGSGMKTLDVNQKKSFRNPNWIGWKDLILDDYCDSDKKFLKKQLKYGKNTFKQQF